MPPTAPLFCRSTLKQYIFRRLRPPPRLRETYYIARFFCSLPLLLLPVVQGASRTLTTNAWGAMAVISSDDLNSKIGDLLSHPLSPATCQTCARPFMLTRTIQAHTCMFARAPVHACAPATRAHKLLLAICSQDLPPGDLLSRSLSHATSTPCARP